MRVEGRGSWRNVPFTHCNSFSLDKIPDSLINKVKLPPDNHLPGGWCYEGKKKKFFSKKKDAM